MDKQRRGEVKITKGGVEAHVMAESVAAWERNGWTAEDDGSSAKTVPDQGLSAAQPVVTRVVEDPAHADKDSKEK